MQPNTKLEACLKLLQDFPWSFVSSKCVVLKHGLYRWQCRVTRLDMYLLHSSRQTQWHVQLVRASFSSAKEWDTYCLPVQSILFWDGVMVFSILSFFSLRQCWDYKCASLCLAHFKTFQLKYTPFSHASAFFSGTKQSKPHALSIFVWISSFYFYSSLNISKCFPITNQPLVSLICVLSSLSLNSLDLRHEGYDWSDMPILRENHTSIHSTFSSSPFSQSDETHMLRNLALRPSSNDNNHILPDYSVLVLWDTTQTHHTEYRVLSILRLWVWQ